MYALPSPFKKVEIIVIMEVLLLVIFVILLCMVHFGPFLSGLEVLSPCALFLGFSMQILSSEVIWHPFLCCGKPPPGTHNPPTHPEEAARSTHDGQRHGEIEEQKTMVSSRNFRLHGSLDYTLHWRLHNSVK